MSLQKGDWVRTESGEIGRIVDIYRLTAFVDLKGQMNNDDIQGFLLSTLTKIDPPIEEGETPP
jgi:preprotein translocase subunit YajC